LTAAFERGRRWLYAERTADTLFPPIVRRLGTLWVAVSLPFAIAVSALVHSTGAYVFVWVFLASGPYTAPALVVGWKQVRRGPRRDRLPYALFYGALASVFGIGVALLVGLATGWRWGNALGVPAVVVSGLFHWVGLWTLMRRRSGRLGLGIDVVEGAAALVALGAPVVLLAGPALVHAHDPWFALPAAVSLPFVIWSGYWGLLLLVRLGPGRGLFEACFVAVLPCGSIDAVLQMAQGISGFTLPAPPLIAVHGLCMSVYLLVPLYMPLLIRPGLDVLPPQSQVRGGWMAAGFVVAGVAGLLVATVAVAGRERWAVPFALATMSALLLLAMLRQVAAVGETRRLYRQVEEASDQRRRLVAQLLERAIHERRRFAGQLYEQAVAAYTSFSVMAGSEGALRRSSAPAAEISARVGGDFARQAESVRELVLAIRPLEGEPTARDRLGVPIRAYLASIYGDRPSPRLAVEVAEALAPDWMIETLVLQIVQEALDNVCQHSQAGAVGVAMDADDEAVRLRVADDGVGFDPEAVPEGSGIATMRASVAVVGGTLTVDARPGRGTVITARLRFGWLGPDPDTGPEARLRLLPLRDD
jgi:signal transduction histidine kinase